MDSVHYPSQYPPVPPGLSVGLSPRDHHYSTGRTPSPTPSEVEALSGGLLNPKKYMNWRFWARKDWIKWYIIGGVLLVITILVSVFDKQIVKFLQPAGDWAQRMKFGWLIPVGVLFVISFPPLFGHEIVAILVGVIWGLGVGFAIVSFGTFLGEVGNYYAFKYLCRSRGEKLERTNIQYACLAEVVRQGGFKMALIIRLSVIPGHFSTAVFSTCGMSIFVFSLAAFFSLPKQLITVYIGVILKESGTGGETTRDKIISDSVLGVTILITALAAWYIWKAVEKVKPEVIYKRRKARQVKLMNAGYTLDNPSTALLNGTFSSIDLPLAPQPQRPGNRVSFLQGQQPQRYGSGANMGYGGYAPTLMQGRYGEPDDEEKEEQDWETRPRVGDLRGANWGGARGKGSDEEMGVGLGLPFSSSTASRSPQGSPSRLYPAPPVPAPPVLYPPPPAPPAQPTTATYPPGGYQNQAPAASPSHPNPFDESYASAQTHPVTPEAPTRRAFQISDPPVTVQHHYPDPSTDSQSLSMSIYPPPSTQGGSSLYPPRSQGGHFGDSSYGSSTDSQAHYDEQFEHRHGHAVEPTDASFYTAADSLESRSGSPDKEVGRTK